MSRTSHGWLLVRAPGAPEQQHELRGLPTRIGRFGPGNQIGLADNLASARHAEIVEEDGRLWVRDLGSTNGTRLNEWPLAPNTPVLLHDGDRLRIGSSTLTYRTEPTDGRAAGYAGPKPKPPPAPPNRPEGTRRSPTPPLPTPPPLAAPARHRVAAIWRSVLAVVVALAVLAGAAWVLAPPRLAVVVLGSDARPDEVARGQPGRTDTVMTIVADRPPAGAAIISLPRDLWLAVPGHGEERINAAYALAGPDAAKRAVGDVLGVRVDRYLLVGLQGVRDIVDAVGGVDVEVETPIHDAAFPTDDYGTVVVDIPAGRQHMDGETALRYARTRHQDNDFGRVARQQRVLLAIRGAMLQPHNWWRAPAVLAAVQRSTRTDLGPLDLVALGLSLVGSSGEPQRLAVGPGLVEEFSGADGAYLLRPTPILRRTVADLLARRPS